MTLLIKEGSGDIKQYKFNTILSKSIKTGSVVLLIIFITLGIYKILPNPYLCYGYKPIIKIRKNPIEFRWTGESYECRFAIANSGVLTIENPVLHLYFIDGATVRIDPRNKEWQANDQVNYFWAKGIKISGGIRKVDYAERAWPINVIFHKNGINKIKYIITSNGIQKIGIIKAINNHYESSK